MKSAVLGIAALAACGGVANANVTAWNLGSGSFSQNWNNINLITVSDDWSGVPSLIGYRGDALTGATGVDPQTIVADASGTPVDVNANQTNPLAFFTGGLTEFELADPVVALFGSGTADVPVLQVFLDTTGQTTIAVSYLLRDIEDGTDNAIQQFALQYRVGGVGNFTNIAAAYVPDATTVNAGGMVTPVSVFLPAAAENQSLVEVRWVTTNAAGNDEAVGVDDILITSIPTPGSVALLGLGGLLAARRRRA